MGALSGVRVIEIAGLGPAPFCGMLLADMGADVVLVERPTGDALGLGGHAIFNRGKRSIALDLKDAAGRDAARGLIDGADVLIEGMRPGAMERLGLGPDACLARRPTLVYGRMTGWGQDGPLAQAAGHDINYAALSGASWFAGAAGEAPVPPPTLVGDIGGGALYLALGVLAALLSARASGRGQVVDAAIVDGSANMMNLILSLHAAGLQPLERGQGLLDGPHWYGAYACADARVVTVGALEPRFNALLLDRLGLAGDPDFGDPNDARSWPRLRARLAALFATRPAAHWTALLEGTDACFAPLLSPRDALTHPHMAARGVYAERDGVLQAAPAPRFSATPSARPGVVPACGEHGAAVLREAGLAHLIEFLPPVA